jgi:hypothetical protein
LLASALCVAANAARWASPLIRALSPGGDDARSAIVGSASAITSLRNPSQTLANPSRRSSRAKDARANRANPPSAATSVSFHRLDSVFLLWCTSIFTSVFRSPPSAPCAVDVPTVAD